MGIIKKVSKKQTNKKHYGGQTKIKKAPTENGTGRPETKNTRHLEKGGGVNGAGLRVEGRRVQILPEKASCK